MDNQQNSNKQGINIYAWIKPNKSFEWIRSSKHEVQKHQYFLNKPS